MESCAYMTDRPIHYLRASKAVDRRFIATYNRRPTEFEALKLWKGRWGVAERNCVLKNFHFIFLCENIARRGAGSIFFLNCRVFAGKNLK